MMRTSAVFLLAFLIFLPTATTYAATYLGAGDFIAQQDSQRSQSADVSHSTNQNTGAAQQEVALTLPPGRNGMTPKVSLVYNSQTSDNVNVYGYGWTDSIPYIERINKHGTDKLYQYNDFYSSVDGELLPITSTSTTSFRARTENGSFNKYDLVTGDSWLMTDKLGTTYKFGYATTTSRLNNVASTTMIYRWMLQETRDKNGNYVTYEYYKDSNEIYPSKIKYTGFGSNVGLYQVEFLREARTDIATSSLPTFPVVSKYRVNQILVDINGAWVRKYDLAYTSGDNGKRSLLSFITETGKDESGGTVTLPATTFTYQSTTGKKGWTLDDSIAQTDTFAQADVDNGVRTVDINGDGLPDLPHYVANTNPATGVDWTLRVLKLSNGNGWATSTALDFPSDINLTQRNADTGVRLADVNGDGLTDILWSMSVSSQNPAYPNTFLSDKAYINTGNAWVASSTWNPPIAFAADAFEAPYYAPQIIDLNGDGLPDIISASVSTTSRVYMNNAAGWTLSTSTGYGTFVPGVYLSGHNQDNGVQLVDVNGDHLPDVVQAIHVCHSDGVGGTTCDAPQTAVYLNTGTGWATTTTPWTIPFQFVETHSEATPNYVNDWGVRFDDVNGDGLVDVIRAHGSVGDCSDCATFINTGAGWTQDTLWVPPEHFIDNLTNPRYRDAGGRLIDMDGDGHSEIIRAYGSGTNSYAAYRPNDAGIKADLLSKTLKATGALVTNTYKEAAQYTIAGGALANQIPFDLTTLYKSETYDGFGATTTLTYGYGDGFYFYQNPFDRKFAGFGTSTEADSIGNKRTTYFHQGNASLTSLGESSDSYSKTGKPYRTEASDSNGNLYDLLINWWNTFAQGNSRNFVSPAQTVSYNYDGNASHRDSAESYTYDNTYGNLTLKTQWGEVTGASDGSFTDIGSDKRIASTTYAASTTPYIVGLPSQETFTAQTGAKISETKHYYDRLALNSVDKGNETKTELWKSGLTYINTQKAYNTYGLVASSTDPRGKVTTYTYEPQNLYIATSTNPLNQQTQFYYDYSLGKPKQTIDPNTRVFQTDYDGLDRPIAEKQPDIASPGTLVTKKTYAYTDTIGSRKILETNNLDGSTNFTLYTYLDGLSRTIQTRKEAEDANKFSVRDFGFNTLGLLQKESLPYFSTNSSRTTATSSTALFTNYTYDPLKRISTLVTVVGTTTNAYDNWVATTTDALGHNKALAYDAYKRLSQVNEVNGASTYVTQYAYDAADNLTKVTDANANIRNFTYDGLKRRLTAEDLHNASDATFGSWAYAFDDAGNLASTTDPKGQLVNYTYDNVNRALTEDFTGLAGTEVSYAYDTCTEGVGRLCIATSGAVSAFTYNALGLPASEQKTIATSTYTTSYSYDRQGNPTNITYPDNSQVQYTYNTAGLLESIQQKESGGTFTDIVSNFNYGPHEKPIFKAFGNGVKTQYTYDVGQLYRLKNIYTIASSTYSGTGGGFALLNSNLWKNFAKATEEFPLALKGTFSHVAEIGTDAVFQASSSVAETTPTTTTTLATTTTLVPTDTATSSQGIVIGISTSTATTTPPAGTSAVVPDTGTTIPPETASTTPQTEVPLTTLQTASTTPVATDLASTTGSVAITQVQPVSQMFNVSLSPTLKESGDSAVQILKDKPEVRLKKWNGEAEIAVSYRGVTGETADPTLSGKAAWGTGEKEVHAYTLPGNVGMENGGFEFEVVLNQKPDTNTFDFTIRGADNLDFLYQPGLNEEKQSDDVASCTETECFDKKGTIVAERPENVVGSYAVYHKVNKNHIEGEKNYATGKAFHIYRPKVKDSSGKEVWGTLTYLPAPASADHAGGQTGQNGALSVQVPQAFLDSATYPVTVDPTFGYGSVGGTSAIMNQDAAYAIQNWLVDSNSVVSKLTLYERVFTEGTKNFKGLIYSNSASYPNQLLGSSATTSVNNTVAAWQDLTFATPVTLANTGAYWLGFVSDAGTPYQVYYYDSSATSTNRYARPALSGDFNSTPGTYPAGATPAARLVSLYATYAPVATSSGANTHSLTLNKSSSQYASTPDSTSLSITGDYTVEAWVKLSSLPTSGAVYPIVEKNDGGSSRSTNFLVQDGGGGNTLLSFGVDQSGNNTVVSSLDYTWNPSTNVWNHVAGVFTAATGKVEIFLNGVSVGSAIGSATSIYDNNASTYVGFQGGTTRYFDGKIDDIRIWNTARTASQISSNRSIELTGSETGLKAYWKLNNNTNDTTSNGNSLTLSGSPSYSTDVPFSGSSPAPSAPTSLQTEGQTNPTNLTNPTPNFTAIYNDADTTDVATNYQVQVSATSTFATTVWDSTKTLLSSSTPQGTRTPNITYNGSTLTASSTYYWRIKLWDTAANEGAWSTATSTFSLVAQQGSYSNTNSLALVRSSTQYASASDSSSLSITGDISVEAWIKIGSFTAGTPFVIASKVNGSVNGGGWILNLEDIAPGDWRLGLQVSGGAGNNTTRGGTNFANLTGQWVHVAGTWTAGSGNRTYVYVNGVDDGASGGSTTGQTAITDTNTETFIGAQNNGGPIRLFDGKVDDVRIWNVARTAQQILDNKSIELVVGNQTGLAAYWKLNGNGTDSTANSNTLTLFNSPVYSTDVPFVGAAIVWDGIQNLSYTYDAVGNILTIRDTSATVSGRTEAFTYDDLYRLTTALTTLATSTPYSDTYTYDALGNITNKTGIGAYLYQGTTTGSYANPHAATSINGLTVSYDKDGNLTNYASTTNAWDYRNRLTQSFASSSPTVNYWYDDGMTRVLLGTPTATTTYPNKYYNIATSSSSVVKHIFTPDGELVATIKGSGATTSREYLHLDQLGSVAAITNSAGTTTSATSYYPYGTERVTTGSRDQRGYISGERNATNDYYLVNRSLNTDRGQFTSEDPSFLAVGNPTQLKQKTSQSQQQFLADPQQANSYSYARDNPIIYKDPNGNAIPILGIFFVYGVVQTGIDIYDAKTVFIDYPKEFSKQEKVLTAGKIGLDATLGVAERGAEGAARTAIKIIPAVLDVFDKLFSTQLYKYVNQNINSNQQNQNNNSLQSQRVQTYTTPNGAVVDANGKLVSGPPKKDSSNK